jgi:hypothetical protein
LVTYGLKAVPFKNLVFSPACKAPPVEFLKAQLLADVLAESTAAKQAAEKTLAVEGYGL